MATKKMINMQTQIVFVVVRYGLIFKSCPLVSQSVRQSWRMITGKWFFGGAQMTLRNKMSAATVADGGRVPVATGNQQPPQLDAMCVHKSNLIRLSSDLRMTQVIISCKCCCSCCWLRLILTTFGSPNLIRSKRCFMDELWMCVHVHVHELLA